MNLSDDQWNAEPLYFCRLRGRHAALNLAQSGVQDTQLKVMVRVSVGRTLPSEAAVGTLGSVTVITSFVPAAGLAGSVVDAVAPPLVPYRPWGRPAIFAAISGVSCLSSSALKTPVGRPSTWVPNNCWAAIP